ncbi:MAG: type II toxin-antitoxin system VapC family toxin [Polyangiaceae bacterium]|nr:type II toxin-antitoxin system VapC family toxin [Polyangiaceae bacterium]
MIGFFDTSVHVALLRGEITVDHVLERAPVGPIRLSPVVASELLRGARGRAVAAVERMIKALVPLEPPGWGARWLEAGRLLSRVFADHQNVGLARLQNDVLIALTARHTGALLVTLDRHFTALSRVVPFGLVVLPVPACRQRSASPHSPPAGRLHVSVGPEPAVRQMRRAPAQDPPGLLRVCLQRRARGREPR